MARRRASGALVCFIVFLWPIELLVVHATATESITISLPYYECIRNYGETTHEPGICSAFHTRYQLVSASPTFTYDDANALCESNDFKGFHQTMAMATLDWSAEECVIYVASFVSREFKARAGETDAPNFDEQLQGHYLALDEITDSMGSGQFIEGNIWQFQKGQDSPEDTGRLKRKRQCLLTALAAAVPPSGKVAEIGACTESCFFGCTLQRGIHPPLSPL